MTEEVIKKFIDSGMTEEEFFKFKNSPEDLMLLSEYLLDLKRRREEFKKATSVMLNSIKKQLPWLQDMVYEKSELFNIVLVSKDGIKYCLDVHYPQECKCVLINGDRGSLLHRVLEEQKRIRAINTVLAFLLDAAVIGGTLFENFGYNFSAGKHFVIKGINSPVLSSIIGSDNWMITDDLMLYSNESSLDVNGLKDCVQIKKVSNIPSKM